MTAHLIGFLISFTVLIFAVMLFTSKTHKLALSDKGNTLKTDLADFMVVVILFSLTFWFVISMIVDAINYFFTKGC